MSRKNLRCAALLSLACWSWFSTSFAADVNFIGATVKAVETRTNAWGSWLIITLNVASGNQIPRLCDAAPAPGNGAVALPMSDPAAKLIQSIALMAKATGKTVTGWGLDATQGNWCGIGNFAVYP